MNLILIAVISLGAIALVLAAILYVASKKFAVYEDHADSSGGTRCGILLSAGAARAVGIFG